MKVAVFGLVAGLFCGRAALAYDGWHLERTFAIPSGTSSFDYISFDGGSNRLFIGHRKEGLQVFDVASGTVAGVVAGTPEASSNGAVVIPEFDLGVSSNENGTLIPFRLSSLEALPPVKLAEELDTSHYDPAAKRLFVNLAPDATGTDIAVLDMPSLARAGTVRVKARKPEHAVFDGAGLMYLAARDLDVVYRIDTRTMAVTAEWPTAGCGQANSTALDAANKRLFVACRGSDKIKPSLIVVDTDTGRVGYTAEIGGGNDGLVFDARSKRIFAACGLNAVLNVFEQVDADTYKPVEAVGTRAMVKVLAFDTERQKLYSMTAETAADFGKKINTAVGPFYPNTFIRNTFTVLQYSRSGGGDGG